MFWTRSPNGTSGVERDRPVGDDPKLGAAARGQHIVQLSAADLNITSSGHSRHYLVVVFGIDVVPVICLLLAMRFRLRSV
jgi:hypothetical protein